jgi:hypothetical protein
VAVPVDVVGIGIDDVIFLNAVFPVYLDDNLQISLSPMPNVEIDFAPTYEKFIVEIVDPLKITPKITVYRRSELFRKLHPNLIVSIL